MLHVEPLTQGLVTARDASLLGEGELTLATGGIYRPYNQAISPLKARSQFGNSVAVNITGLRATPFETDGVTTTRAIIAHGTIWQSGVGGAWVTFRSGVTTGNRIESIGFENVYYLSNGVDDPVAWDGGTTTIGHGMIGTESDEFEMNNIGGSNGDWSLLGTGMYSWWFTEYDSVRDIESATENGLSEIVDANTDTIEMTIAYGQADYLTLHNSNATHWRIYRSPGPREIGDVDPFPEGFLIGTVSIPGAPAVTTFNDTGIVSDTPYAVLTLSIAGGAAVTIERDEVPPTWSTGDVFEDSIVVNDVAEPAVVRYSFPGKPHSFPELYFIGFNTKQVDKVTCIRTLDAVCVVGLQSQVWRLNYLPNETDSEFQRGRCREVISANHGIVGPDAACLFTPVEGTSYVAYISTDGLYMTDGIRTKLLTMDLDWESLVNKSALSSAIIVNAQHLWSLFVYFVGNGGSAPNDKVIQLSYHPQHLKEGGYLKVSGPSTLTARAADYAANTQVALASTNEVHTEDTGAVGSMTVQTRLIYPQAGSLDTETTIERVRILTGPHSGGTYNVALRRRRSDADIATETAVNFTPGTTENRLVRAEAHGHSEAFGALITTNSTLHYIAFEHSIGQR